MPTSLTNGEPRRLALGHRLAVMTLALIGLIGVAPVSIAELGSGGACPQLGPLPACHLVALAYAAILISVLHPQHWVPVLFLAGWLPVFGFAAVGTMLELAGHETCPRTGGGWPKCYFSFALACGVMVPALLHWASGHLTTDKG